MPWGGDDLVEPASKMDTILVTVPMIVVLFFAAFRLDELIFRPIMRTKPGRALCGWDDDGNPVCIQPDGEFVQVSGSRRNSDSNPISKDIPG